MSRSGVKMKRIMPSSLLSRCLVWEWELRRKWLIHEGLGDDDEADRFVKQREDRRLHPSRYTPLDDGRVTDNMDDYMAHLDWKLVYPKVFLWRLW